MENNFIIDFKRDFDMKDHPKISGLKLVNGKNNFPISWLNQQGYCEYSLYLQHFEGMVVPETKEMIKGTQVHERLEREFKEKAKPASFKEAVEISKEEKTISREMFVISPKYGIRGFIDEIWMTPTEFIIIDDKPGTRAYFSTINQVRAYCLAFKDMIGDLENRKIRGALRQRGTDNIFFSEPFDEANEKRIKYLIDRMQGLFQGSKPFIPTKNPNKCKKCRYQNDCKHFKKG